MKPIYKTAVFAVLAMFAVGACSTPITFEPDKTGAEHECASHSAHLADYNACMERVEAEYRAYELQRKLEDEDEG